MARRPQQNQENEDRPSSRNVKALVGLLPFVLKYKGRLALVFFFLTFAASVTLAMTHGVRLLVDNGFAENAGTSVDRYFAFFFGLAVLRRLRPLLKPFKKLSVFATLTLMLTLLVYIGEAIRDAFDTRKFLQ